MHFETQLLALLSSPTMYQARRHDIRPFMLGYKAERAMQLGPFMRLQFEDCLTLAYQVQEVLRMQGLTSKQAFNTEWECYRALHPDIGQINATLMIELDSPSLLKTYLWQLNRAAGALEISAGHGRCKAVINTDLQADDERPMGVHFLSFRPSPAFLSLVANGEPVRISCEDKQFKFDEKLATAVSNLFKAEAISRLTRPADAKRF